MAAKPRLLDLLWDRFSEFVVETENCWEWRGAHNNLGYGQLWYGERRMVYTHRFSYEHFVGPIPGGYDIDHLCKNPGCCNPEHLEAVTHRENIRRGRAATKTSCKYGHDWTEPANVYVRKDGRRYCAACSRERQRKAYAAQAA